MNITKAPATPAAARSIREVALLPLSTKAHGMGLGLSIARSIVEARGDTIEAVARAGGGTIFRFLLPTTRPSADTVGRSDNAKSVGTMP